MTSVTNSLAADAAILASALNTNFTDLVSLATAVGNEQITGGLTYDKLADRNGPSWVCIPLVPYCFSANMQTATDFTIPTAMTAIARFVPIMKAGVEGFLCGIAVNAMEATKVGASTPRIQVYLNGTTLLATLDLSAATDTILQAQNDPLANPLCSLSDGDYLEIRLGPDTGTDAAIVRGVNCYLAMKYQLCA